MSAAVDDTRQQTRRGYPGGSGSVVEHLLAKEKVAGSNPVFRSKMVSKPGQMVRFFAFILHAGVAEWQTLRS